MKLLLSALISLLLRFSLRRFASHQVKRLFFFFALLFFGGGLLRANAVYYTVPSSNNIYYMAGATSAPVLVAGSAVGHLRGLELDANGNLYTVNNAGVWRIAPGGTASLFASVYGAHDLVMDSAGNLFVGVNSEVTGSGNGGIRKVAPDGTVTNILSGSQFDYIYGVAIDSENNIYAANIVSGNIYKVTAGGSASLYASMGSGVGPWSLAFDSSTGNLYTSNVYSPSISVVRSSGSISTLFSEVTSTTRTLEVGPDGFLYGAQLLIHPDGTVQPYPLSYEHLHQSTGIVFVDSNGSSPNTSVADSASTLCLMALSALGVISFRRKRSTPDRASADC